MPQLEHLEDQYLQTRQMTDLWQSAQLNGEPVRLEATVPSKEPKPDIPGGVRSNEEIDAILAAQPARKEKTVELPEVQAIRQQYQEHLAKISTGEAALAEVGKVVAEVGKAGRSVAEAIAPGVEVAGRAMGLDEEGAAALSKGLVEFIAGLPGENESDTVAGIETALAALPMVGAIVKGGKVVGKALGPTIAKEFEKAVTTLKTERGSVPVGGKTKEKLPGGGKETPVTWEEAIQIDEHEKAFTDRLKTFDERLSKQRRGVRYDVQVTSDSISPDALQLEAFLNLTPGTILKDSDVVAAKRMFKDLAEPVRKLSQWVTANPGDQQAFLALLAQLPKVDQGVASIAGAYAESGRTQRLLSKDRPTGGMIPSQSKERVRISDPYINQWLEFFKEQEALAKTGAPALTKEKLVEVLAGMKTPEEFMAAAKALAKPTKWDMFIEYWINGLLSGPATHATNILSNAATIAWGIPERQLAAMFSKDVRPSEAGAMLGGILEAQGDAWRLAWKAFKEEESQLGLGPLEAHQRAITADALELTGVPGRAVDFLGTMIRLPGRTLMAADDYFKSIAYRAELRALAKRESFKAVSESNLEGPAARSRMREIEERILAAPPEAIDEAAKEYASYVTFTRELGETGQRVQALANTPVGRLVLPFVRTPTNIFKYSGERTPLAFASQAVRDEISAGGSRRALALAKISLGSMTMSYMGMLASEGILTGGGPKDKALRAEMMMTGWQPYSIKVGDTYYKYGRLSPIADFLSFASDASELLAQLPERDAEQLAAGLVVALSRNVSQKSFVKGLAGTLNAIASQDLNIVKGFFEQELPTILPFSTGLGQMARLDDPVMREVNSILDAFKAKIPGLSSTLPPRRNLWGEPIMLEGGLGPDLISPIYTTTNKLDSVAQELARLQIPVGMPGKNIEGVPLTGSNGPWEYDAYVVLQGAKPIIGDLTLRARLADLTQSDLYKQSSDGPDGGKKVLIQTWVSRYREMARHILSDAELSRQYGYDFPDLRQQIEDKRNTAIRQFQSVP
jgi:hypothetical protein